MRRIGSAAFVIGLALAASGCGGGDFDSEDAEGAPGTSGGHGAAGPGGGAMGAGGSDDGEAEGGAGGEGDGTCNPEATPADAACVVDDAFGIFVRAEGDDAAAGTMNAPVRTLAKAIELASGLHKRVYACAQTFAEAVVVPGGVSIFGGLDCDDYWSFKTGALTRIEAPTEMAVRIAGGSGATRLADLRITSADASGAGHSSTAVFVDGIDAELTRCEVYAGNGAPGSSGADNAGTAAAGPNGKVGYPACYLSSVAPGGLSVSNPSCSSSGGEGGDGIAFLQGGEGDDGLPAMGGGSGGHGQSSPSWSCYTGAGLAGKSALAAEPGEPASLLGSLVEGVGYVGGNGHDGANGKAGQGGGGGGGSTGACGNSGAGASGGSGGAGGCGGLGGQGGGAGGSSIGIAIRSAKVILNDVELAAQNGAEGGQGGHAEAGGAGGDGGAGGIAVGSTLGACTGGKGGKGGHGGGGSGGAGGHSAGIVFFGAVPTLLDVTVTLGVPGTGGGAPSPNSNNEGAGLDGPDGQAKEVIAL